MVSLGCLLVILVATMVSAPSVDGHLEQVGVMVGKVVEHHLPGCHLVLITTSQHSHVFSSIIRHLSVDMEAGLLVEAVSAQDHLLQGLLVEEAALREKPETRVVVVGGMAGVKDVLLHHSLRNTIHGLYLALHELTLHTPSRTGNSRLKKVFQQR
ncbi:putative Proteasome subunit alpha type-2-like 7, partial [Homarus americanus]